MKVTKVDDKLILTAPYEKKDLVKAIGNYRWNKQQKVWEFPFSSVIPIVEFLNVEITDEVGQIYQEYKDKEKERQKKIEYVQTLYAKNWDNQYPGLFKHQKIALEATSQFDSYCLFFETGVGKTLVAIELIKNRKAPVLVVAPLSILEAVWTEEIEKFAPELKVINLWNHLDWIEKEADVYVINYEQFKKFYEKEPDVIEEKIRKLRRLWKKTADPEKIEKIRDQIDILTSAKNKAVSLETKIKFLIIDESSKMKAPTTQITKAILFYKDKIPYRLVMSGTPAPNSILEFWGQACFINSKLLGDNFYRFRNTYFTSYGYGNYQWNVSADNREKIMNRIKEQAIFFSKKDALDLPEQIIEKRYLEMDGTQRKIYKEMLNENIARFKDKVSISSTELTKLMKLREITSGFFFDDKGKAVTISERKIDILMEVLEEIGNHQVTIFCNFDWEITILKDRLGEKAVVLSGIIKKQRDKDKNIEMFKDNAVQYLVANVASSAHGLNLQNCHYAIYFSLSYSHEDHKQSQDRFHRQGQKNNVTYFYPLMKQSIDEVLYKVLVKKANLLDSCMEMLKCQGDN